jgi:hypothetical protein
MVGLSNVDDTSDANKPVSTSVQTALGQSTLKFANINRTTVSSNTQNPGVSNDQFATAFVTDAVTTASSTTSSNLVNLTTNQTISGIKSFMLILLLIALQLVEAILMKTLIQLLD